MKPDASDAGGGEIDAGNASVVSALCRTLGDGWRSVLEAEYIYEPPVWEYADRANLKGVRPEDVRALVDSFENPNNQFAYVQKATNPKRSELDAVRECTEAEVQGGEVGSGNVYLVCHLDDLLPDQGVSHGESPHDRVGISSNTSDVSEPAIYKDRVTTVDGNPSVSSFFVCCQDNGEIGQRWKIDLCQKFE